MKKLTLTEILSLMGVELVHQDGSQITYRRPNGSIGVMTHNDEPSLTQQQFADEVNVNKIMDRYAKAPNPAIFIRAGKGLYGDFSQAKDFQTSLEIIQQAEDAFMSLDAKIRDRFQNDPAQLLSFLSDSKNLKEARELGLVDKSDPIPEDASNEAPQAPSPASPASPA